MKKRVFAILLCIAMVVTMVACGKKKEENEAPEACEIMTIEKYVGLEIESTAFVEATDDDVESSIRSTMDAMGLSTSKEVKKGKVEDGDIALIDYVGKMDGEEFDGGSAEGYSLTIGSDTFIPGFEDGIIGHKKGETFDLNLTFPEDYTNTTLAGQAVVFTVTIQGITKVTYPELTDEVATTLNADTAITADAYREQVRVDLNTSNEEALKSQNKSLIWEALMEQCDVYAFPEKDLEAEEEELTSNMYYMAYQYGYTSVDSFVLDYYGVRTDVVIKDMLKQQYAIEIIAYEQNFVISEEEYQTKLKEYAEQYGYDTSDEESLAEFETSITREALEETLMYEKVTEYLLDNCIIKTTSSSETATE